MTVASVVEGVLRKHPEETDVDDELERLIQGIGGLIDHRFPDWLRFQRHDEGMNMPEPKLILSPQQAKSVAEQAKRCSHVEVEDSRAGYLKVRSFDREGEPIDERWIDSDGLDRLRSLLRHDEDVHRDYPPGD